MNLARFLSEERVDLALDEAFDDEHPLDVESLAAHMAELLVQSDQIVNATKLRTDLVNAARRDLSLPGHGLALPHVRTLQARKLVMAVAVSQAGLDLPTPDDEPLRLVIAMVGPTYDDKQYLQVYKRLSERLQDPDGVRAVLEASEPGEVLRALSG